MNAAIMQEFTDKLKALMKEYGVESIGMEAHDCADWQGMSGETMVVAFKGTKAGVVVRGSAFDLEDLEKAVVTDNTFSYIDKH